MAIRGSLQISLENESAAFLPGQQVRGQITWALEQPPCALEVRLFWYASEEKSQTVEVADRYRVGRPAQTGQESFCLVLPGQPYSFTGKILKVRWALEFLVIPGSEAERVDLVVSPTRQAIVPTPYVEDGQA